MGHSLQFGSHHSINATVTNITSMFSAVLIPCCAEQAAGVHVKGFAPTLDILQQYKVCLAPLRYGAGLKGKIVDSWKHGLPVCTTPVGAEGMFPATSYAPEGFPDTGVSLCWQQFALWLPVVTTLPVRTTHFRAEGMSPATSSGPQGISATVMR